MSDPGDRATKQYQRDLRLSNAVGDLIVELVDLEGRIDALAKKVRGARRDLLKSACGPTRQAHRRLSAVLDLLDDARGGPF